MISTIRVVHLGQVGDDGPSEAVGSQKPQLGLTMTQSQRGNDGSPRLPDASYPKVISSPVVN